MMHKVMRQGFTLIEVLVTLILLAILVAVVFPVVVQQIEDAEPTKMASDLANIRTGIDLFHLNLRPQYPGDLEDLIHQIDANDRSITGTAYHAPNRWNGAYLDVSPLEGNEMIGNAIATGLDLQIQNELVCYDLGANNFEDYDADPASCATGQSIAVKIQGESGPITMSDTDQGPAFDAIDDFIDDGDGPLAGRVRAARADGSGPFGAVDGPSVIIYLAGPYTN